MKIQNQDYKVEYNKLLKRQQKAAKYLDDTNRTEEEIDKWLPEYNKILKRMNFCLSQIKDFTSNEVLNGFSI